MDNFLPAGFGLVFEDDNEYEMQEEMLDNEKYPLARVVDENNEVFSFCNHMKDKNDVTRDKKLIAVYLTYYSVKTYEC